MTVDKLVRLGPKTQAMMASISPCSWHFVIATLASNGIVSCLGALALAQGTFFVAKRTNIKVTISIFVEHQV